MVRVTYPLDKVFAMVMLLAVIEDGFDFEFVMVIDGDRIRRRNRWGVMVDGIGRLVGMKG